MKIKTLLVLIASNLLMILVDISSASDNASSYLRDFFNKEVERERYPWWLSVGEIAPELYSKKWLNGDNVRTLDEIQGDAYLIVAWNPRMKNAERVVSYLNLINRKYRKQGLVVISFALTDPPARLLFDNPLRHIAFVDNDRQTYKAYTGKRERYAVHAFIFDANKKLIWEGFPLNMASEIIEKLLCGKLDIDKILNNMDKINAFYYRLNKMFRNCNWEGFYDCFIPIMELSPQMNYKDSLKLSILILSLTWYGRLNEIPAALEYWIEKITTSDFDARYGIEYGLNWLPSKDEHGIFENTVLSDLFSYETITWFYSNNVIDYARIIGSICSQKGDMDIPKEIYAFIESYYKWNDYLNEYYFKYDHRNDNYIESPLVGGVKIGSMRIRMERGNIR